MNTLQLHKLPPADRAILAAKIRKAALENHGHFVPDLPPAKRPSLDWTEADWRDFFAAAGWPDRDAAALAKGETPKPEKKPVRAYGVQAALRAIFRSGWTGRLDSLCPKLPQWSRGQIQCGLTHLRDQGEAIMGINDVWRRLNLRPE